LMSVHNNTLLNGSFEDNLGMPVLECQITVEFSAARDDGGGSNDNQNSTLSNHLYLAPVKSPPTKYHAVCANTHNFLKTKKVKLVASWNSRILLYNLQSI